MNKHWKWKDIDNFANMIRSVRRRYDIFAEGRQTYPVAYNAKIKLHGTNAGIVLESDRIYAQGRSRVLTPEDDNFGFARWVRDKVEPAWATLPHDSKDALNDLVIHGEWAGPGVQKNVALTDIPEKTFFVFALEVKRAEDGHDRVLYLEPTYIKDVLAVFKDVSNFVVLPWFYSYDFVTDLYNQADLDDLMTTINEDVEGIGQEDPFIKETFGVTGLGEGLVFYDRKSRSEHLIFKAKCEEHRTVKTRKAAQVNPDVVSANAEFAKSLVTDARLHQGYDVVSENGKIILTMGDVSKFLKWVAGDVEKECQAELEANGKTWKDVAKAVNLVAVNYFKRRQEADAIVGV